GLDAVARVAGARPASVVISVEARDLYESGALARRLRARLGEGWEAVDWGETNRPLFEALALERRTVALIIMLITIVAALNITTTLALVVVVRRADIAVLMTLGARDLSVTLVFMIEGAIVSAVGARACAPQRSCATNEFYEFKVSSSKFQVGSRGGACRRLRDARRSVRHTGEL